MKPVEQDPMYAVAQEIADFLQATELDVGECYAVLSKLTVSIGIDIDTRDEFIDRMLFVYDMERQLNPINPEVH